MRSVVRVAAYVPAGSSGGVRVAASDEDAFTLGATAVERAWGARDVPSEPVVVHLLGDYPAMADWGFPALLGQKAEVLRHPGNADELARTLHEVEELDGGPVFLVATEMPERDAHHEGSSPAATGAGSVAYLLERSARGKPFPFEHVGTARSALTLALNRGNPTGAGVEPPVFVGDWDLPGGTGRPVSAELIRRAAERDASAVSEGAYVPRARYLENLPSRWRLVAEECDNCHEMTFPARGICRRCRRRDTLATVPLPRDGGLVVAITTIGKGGQPTEFDDQVESSGPYSVALVELAEGIRTTLQVTDASPGEVRVSDRVNTLLRRLYPMEGEWRYGRKAVPAPSGAAERDGR
ncbi:MAG TPA: hypothetical protein VJ021_09585 [Thermoplasmata archaeon]|nr:hypothetical protein [Thermoplasmata archaeon]